MLFWPLRATDWQSLTENTNFGTRLHIGFLSGETVFSKVSEFEISRSVVM
jgi:hypothetical protein